jgi:hypothetical protein
MGLDGAASLRRFVERGGLLITEGNSSTLPIQLGFNPSVSIQTPQRLNVRGSVVRAQQLVESPVLAGYENQPTMTVYFNQAPVLAVQPRDTMQLNEGVDTSFVNQQERMRARVLLRFHARADSILVSGMLFNGDELAGRAAVIDAPVGNGHVMLFAIRPFWRWETQGTFALALNAMANWNSLGAGVLKPIATRDSPRAATGEGGTDAAAPERRNPQQ